MRRRELRQRRSKSRRMMPENNEGRKGETVRKEVLVGIFLARRVGADPDDS